MEFGTLASGSGGNASFVCCGDTLILLDAGISARRITQSLRALGLAPERLNGILVTHEHTDHIAGIKTLLRQLEVPVYATYPTLYQLQRKIPGLQRLGRAFAPGESFELGELWIESIPTLHDAICSVGYGISSSEGRIVSLTDLGALSPEVCQGVEHCDLLVCETNHDEAWVRSGTYHISLQDRILSRWGHLSNEMGAELAALAVEGGATGVVLAHLSREHNTPSHAHAVVAERLTQVKAPGPVLLTVAPEHEPGPIYRLSKGEPVAEQREKRAAVRPTEDGSCAG